MAKLSQGYEISLATAQLPQKLFEKYKKFIDSTIDTHDIPESVLDACNSRIRQIHGLEAANNEDNKDSTSNSAHITKTVKKQKETQRGRRGKSESKRVQ